TPEKDTAEPTPPLPSTGSLPDVNVELSLPPAPPPEAVEKAPPSLKKAVLSTAAWTAAGFGTLLLFRFASNAILTYLLDPKVFGLMMLVNVFIVGLHMFTDIGTGLSVIRSPRGDDPDFLNTAWTIQVLRA